MTDIQQWRRRIQPARARTPNPAIELDDTDDMPSPSTPKHGLKSKVSSYFDFRQHTKNASFNDDLEPQLPTWPTDQLYPDPDAEDEMDSVMCRLMADPYAQLDVRFNGALMRIFEKFMVLKEEKEQLQRRLDQEVAANQIVLSRFNMAERDWEDKKQDYKDEIKRLEVLLSKASKRGLAEVTLARQDSKLPRGRKGSDENKETIFEFLEKMRRFDDRHYTNQRATMRPVLQSPSDRDKRLSQRLTQKKSITNIHADLPFGTPPGRDDQFSLARVSMLEQQAMRKTRPRALTTSTDTSGDTFSAFSCEVASPAGRTIDAGNNANVLDASQDSEISELVRLATIAARRRNLDSTHILSQLLDLFKAQRGARTDSAGTLNSMPDVLAPTPKASAPASNVLMADTIPVKRQTVMSKATGLFNKFKPQQLSVDTLGNARAWQRRFSFEPGDDAAIQNARPADTSVPQDRWLRKSVSLDMLPQSSPVTATTEQMLSPVAASPTPSVAPERPPSRIPTPVFSCGSLAKPRQDREDSSSSLLTAIRLAGDPSKRSNSLCSSVYSSPSASREELGKIVQGEAGPSSDVVLSSSNRLLDHTNALRSGGPVPFAPAGAASACSENPLDHRAAASKAAVRANLSAFPNKPDMSDTRPENTKPVDGEACV